MPAYARKQIVAEDVVGVYHCIGRCVRRAMLCGRDTWSGRDFEHRRRWLVARLEQLSGLFAVDVLGFAVMANHLHLVVRTRPDLTSAWDDVELARRWSGLRPSAGADEEANRDARRASAESRERARLAADPGRASELRRRLASLSWLMRELCEPLSRWANQEDRCSGRFWEGRFKSQALLDEAAVLACSIYVDLNPIRAGVADSPETSRYTAAWERIAGLSAAQTAAPRSAAATDDAATGPAAEGSDAREALALADPVAWLAPVADDDMRRAAAFRQPRPSAPVAAAPPTGASGPTAVSAARRASDRGFLPLGLDDYLRLLDWTGRQLRRDAATAGHGGVMPADLAPILTRLGLAAGHWTETIRQFGRWRRWAIGSPQRLDEWRERMRRRWLHGASASRLSFG